MTHIASSLNAVPIEHRQNPACLTAKATTQSISGWACREEYALPNVTEFCSVVNEGQGRASEGANLSSPQGWHPQHTIPQAFERLNAPQMRRDRIDGALPPVWLMLIAAGTCLFTLFLADAMYSAFFEWMVGL